jgi:hypothetical protein
MRVINCESIPIRLIKSIPKTIATEEIMYAAIDLSAGVGVHLL